MSTRRDPDDFAREIEAHLALETDRLIAEGLSPDEARLRARRVFGSTAAATERFHESHRWLWLDQLCQDVRQGARALRRYPIACAVAVLSLAFGIGATTSTLTIRDVIFRKPPPLYREPARLSRIQIGSPEHPLRPASGVPGALFAEWDEARIGAALAAAAPTRVREYRTDDRSDTIRVREATPNLFSVLGVPAALGTTSLTSTTVVLSDRAWRMVFDQRTDVVGRMLWIENAPHVVVGVMPEQFWFSSTDSAVWTLLDRQGDVAETTLEVVARRAPDVTPATLAAQLQSGLATYAARLPAGQRDLRIGVTGIEGTPIGRAVSVALPWLLGTCVALTLLIACANVAILVIAQWTVREHEIAIRASLGATRARVVRALVAESMVIAAIGGTFGVAVTAALIGVITHNAGGDARFFDFSMEPHVLIDAILITLLTGLVSGIGPAVLETRRLQANPMRTLATSDRVRQRWRHALVVMEIAITVALLVVTATMLDAYRRQLGRDLGFSPHPLIALRVEHPRSVPVARVTEVINQLPGVVTSSAATALPYMGVAPLESVATDAAGTQTIRAERVSIGPTFFATLDVPILTGRGFSAADTPTTGTAIVNERLAGALFPRQSALGREIWAHGQRYDIVGIAAQHMSVALQTTDRDPKLYVPLGPQASPKQMAFLIRASSDPESVARALRHEVPAAAAGMVVANLYTLDEIIRISGQEMLVGTAPLAPLIFTGLLLTAAGIYGVLAFAIARRSRELALRIAIGATGRDIIYLVACHGLYLLAAGTIVGVGATFALSRVVRASGGGGSFLDPTWPAFVVPVTIVALIGMAATLVPSRRALKIDPAVLLRTT